MNRRKFFGAVTAAVTAALAPGYATPMLVLDRKGPGYIAARYGLLYPRSHHAWWRNVENINGQNFAKLEVQTLAALQSAWKECLAYKTGDTLIIDEQAYEVFKTLQE